MDGEDTRDAHVRCVEYVLPLRWETDDDAPDLDGYLRWLARRVDVTVVDGSSPALFAAHRRRWPQVRHLVPQGEGANGKARGANTGIRHARHELIVIADDDVRYDEKSLAGVIARLSTADLVRPQNVFRPAPWHARWDTGRSLLNRAFGGDFSGTVGVRRSLARPGYDADVLFENLELERTIRARGGRVVVARDLFVDRRPPAVPRFLEQRVRQAYDGFAQPWRLVRELMILPLLICAARRGPGPVLAGAAAVVAVAALGRARGGGRRRYRLRDPLWAVPWLLERAVTIWLAVGWRLLGGVPYRGRRLRRAATPMRRLVAEHRG